MTLVLSNRKTEPMYDYDGAALRPRYEGKVLRQYGVQGIIPWPPEAGF